MTNNALTESEWRLRAEIYAFMIEHTRAPNRFEVAELAGVDPDAALASMRRLHDAHALYMQPGGDTIRMLNPFSGVPTPFLVGVGQRSYFANCAWDMLAIPALLGRDALIHARIESDGSDIEIPVTATGPQAGQEFIVNFSVPFRLWYDDLVHT